MRARRLVISLSLLLVPSLAAAAFARPSGLLTAMSHDGNPRSFTVEVHANMDDVFASAWLRGESEGKDLDSAKARWKGTIDVADGGSFLRIRHDATLYRKTLYLKLTEASWTEAGAKTDLAPELMNHWVKMDLSEENWNSTDDDASQLQSTLSNIGIDANVEDTQTFLDEALDAVLALTHTKVASGETYTLTLAESPDALIDAFARFTEHWDGLSENETMDLHQGADAFLRNLWQDLRSHMQLRLKIDTTDDFFQFGRLEVSLTPSPELMGINANLLITGERMSDVVKVFVPKNAESIETWADAAASTLIPVLGEITPLVSIPVENWMYTDEEEDTIRSERAQRKGRLERETRETPTIRYQMEIEQQRLPPPPPRAVEARPRVFVLPETNDKSIPFCSTQLGTAEAIGQWRKGYCRHAGRESVRSQTFPTKRSISQREQARQQDKASKKY